VTLLYAHRGAACERPENTMVSFERGVFLGAQALETDVHLSADGHVVISHDPDGARMCGVHRAISASTLAEMRRWDAGWGFVDKAGARPFAGRGITIPTLAELLDAFPALPVNVDLKAQSPALVDAFVALIRRRGDEARVTAASFHRQNLKRVRAAGYGGATALAPSEVLELFALPPRLWRRLPLRGTAAQLPTRARGVRLTRPAVLRRCHAAGVRVDFWTVNDPEAARALVALGVDGVMTDDPGALAPVFRAAARSP
jgi:glycerophosphoryl diester phosphodiesterase